MFWELWYKAIPVNMQSVLFVTYPIPAVNNAAVFKITPLCKEIIVCKFPIL